MKRFLFGTAVLLIAVCLLLAPTCALGQGLEGGLAPILPSASAASYYYISKPGELTMQVNIWGSIRNPGRYEVPSSTDLIQLLSYAGGPNPDASMDDVRLTRTVRKEGTVTREQFYLDLDDLSQVDDSKLVLNPGDTIFIDRTGWSSFRDYLTVVTTAAIITTAVANVIIANSRTTTADR